MARLLSVSQWLRGVLAHMRGPTSSPEQRCAASQAAAGPGTGSGLLPRLTRADLPTPPEPSTTSLYSRMVRCVQRATTCGAEKGQQVNTELGLSWRQQHPAPTLLRARTNSSGLLLHLSTQWRGNWRLRGPLQEPRVEEMAKAGSWQCLEEEDGHGRRQTRRLCRAP